MMERKYFIKIDEEVKGSYTIDSFRSMWKAGIINAETLVALDGREGMLKWRPLRNIKTLKAEETSPSNLALKSDTEKTCPKCAGDMTIPTELAGQIVSCPHCGESILPPKKEWAASRRFKRICVSVIICLVGILWFILWFIYLGDFYFFICGTLLIARVLAVIAGIDFKDFKYDPRQTQVELTKAKIQFKNASFKGVFKSILLVLMYPFLLVSTAIIHAAYYPNVNIYSFLFSICISLLVIGIGLVIYFFPVYMAIQRKHKNIAAIFALNLLTGWTFIGWVISLVWALKVD